MKSKKLLSTLMAFIMVISVITLPDSGFFIEAEASASINFTVNGTPQPISYALSGGRTYVKLRDIAAALNSTERRFNVVHSTGIVNVTLGEVYGLLPTDLKGGDVSLQPRFAADTLRLNGAAQLINGYKIDDFNYFDIYELAGIIGFTVNLSANAFAISVPMPPEPVEYPLWTITDRLETSGTIKNYEVVLSKPGRVSLNFRHINLDSSWEFWRITLRDSDDNILLDFRSRGIDTNITANNRYLSAGTYYVRVQVVQSWNHSEADYTLTVNYTENTGQFESEPNDSRETANAMNLNQEITGNLHWNGDVDFYKFTLVNPGRISLNFKHANLENSWEFWRITLHDIDDNILLDFRSRGVDTNITSNNRYLGAGTYYVRIQVNQSWNHSEADYTLTVNYTENTGQFEIESNDSRATATGMNINQAITGNLHWNGDVDFYRFTLTSPHKVSLNFRHANLESTIAFWNITLFDSTQNQVLAFNSRGIDTNLDSQEININAGTYYVRVQVAQSWNHSEFDYTLTVNATAITIPTITFDLNGGTSAAIAPIATRVDGRLESLPTPPTKSDHTFSGWFTAATGGTQVTTSTVFTANTTIFARWTPLPTYTITFNANNGTVTPASAVTGTDGRLATLPIPTRSGFAFNGWFTTAVIGGTQVSTNTVFTTNSTIFARWTQGVAYAVTVNNGTGGGSFAQGATINITAGTPPTGQQFKNWTTTSAGVTFANANSASTSFTMPANAVTVTANFEPISETPTIRTLVSITPPTAITGRPNDTLKTATALNLPATVIMVTNDGQVQASVTWNVEASTYNPVTTTAQTFTVNGTAALPDGVINPDNAVSLAVSVQVTVNARTTSSGGGSSGGGGGGGSSGSTTPPPTPPTPQIQQTPGITNIIVNMPVTIINTINVNIPVVQLKVPAGATGSQSVNVGRDYAGQNAVLVRYNATTGELEFVAASTVGTNGTANINVRESGDFLVQTFKTGDITGTGEVETSDALALLRHVAGISELNSIQKFVTNGKEGDVGTNDALNILRYVAGIIDKI
jgi:uncharacterized repeat protein (TIGR02543 family)